MKPEDCPLHVRTDSRRIENDLAKPERRPAETACNSVMFRTVDFN
ncbi:hypothetical protein [Burkholderia oklahomensis]|nr:hypothetical protein [Burkholderia oklahomensis]MDN7672500.1 hypothetical protein [Burkholderia oklahomensis]